MGGGGRVSVYRNNYKGYMDKTKVGRIRVGSGDGWGGGSDGCKMETTVLEQQQKS